MTARTVGPWAPEGDDWTLRGPDGVLVARVSRGPSSCRARLFVDADGAPRAPAISPSVHVGGEGEAFQRIAERLGRLGISVEGAAPTDRAPGPDGFVWLVAA